MNFTLLNVLNRADAGGSPIMDTQIPGRTARISAGKEVGIVRDYRDQFNTGFKRKASNRYTNYAGHGWTQVLPGYKRGDKTQLYLFEG